MTEILHLLFFERKKRKIKTLIKLTDIKILVDENCKIVSNIENFKHRKTINASCLFC